MALTKANFRMIDGVSINAVDFGAVGDGLTDDTAALNAAGAAARAGSKSLYIPPCASFYRTTDTVDLSGITFIHGDDAEIRSDASLGAKPAVIIGSSAYGQISLRVRNAGGFSTTAGNIGIRVIPAFYRTILTIYVYGFNEGLKFDGRTTTGLFIGSSINVVSFFNNGSQVVFDLASGSNAVQHEFHGGNYYVGGNSPTANRGTFKIISDNGAICSELKVYDAEIGIDIPNIDLNTHAAFVAADINGSSTLNTVYFYNARLETYSAAGDTLHFVYADLDTTSSRVAVEVNINSNTADEFRLYYSRNDTLSNCLVRYVGQQSVSNQSTDFVSYNEPPNFTATTAGRVYISDRVVFDDNDFSTPVNRIDSSNDNIVIDNQFYPYTGASTFGKMFSKSTAQSAFLKRKGVRADAFGNAQACVICYDASGNVLSGTSPYYVRAAYLSPATYGVGVYRIDGNWIWLHPDVASFYIGYQAWGSASEIAHDQNFECTYGYINHEIKKWKRPPVIIGDTYPQQSYFPEGWIVEDEGSSIDSFANTFYHETATSSAASSGASAIVVSDATGITASDTIGIQLDTVISGTSLKSWQHTTVSSVVGTTVNLAASLTGNVASGNQVRVNRWVTRS